MAKLTNLSKGIIALTVLSVSGAAIWHLGVKNLITSDASAEVADNGADAKKGGGIFGFGGPKADEPLGSQGNPLKVSIVSFHGYAPALLANGKDLTTQPGSVFEEKGVHVQFLLQDDIPTLTTNFDGGVAHCSWRTSDFFAQEHPSLRDNKRDARAIMVVDNTRGADAIIARDSSIQSVEDLPGHKIGLLQFTPSDGMTIDAIASSSLSGRKKKQIDFVYVNADEGTAGVRAMFESGQVDAAALWDPDLSLALDAVDGAHVIYSTKTATNLIYDVIVCDTEYLDNPANEPVFQAFVDGWMAGVELAEDRPEEAVDALVQTEELMGLLAKSKGAAYFKDRLFPSLLWTGLEENARILGKAGGTNHYERVYHDFDVIYREAGYTSPANAPVINASDSFDYRFIDAALARDASLTKEAAKPEFTFSEKERDATASQGKAALTKPVSVNFKTGSAELSKRAGKTIDDEMVSLIESNGAAYFEVSGNTDSTGGRAGNMALSKRRAEAVVSYLASEWEFPRERFVIVGNGPDKPICDEKAWKDEGYADLDACRADNRTTRVAILSR